MQKRTMKNTFSNKGESYIPVCVLVLFLSALVSVLILYIGTMAQVQAQKRDVKTKLDSVVSEYAAEMFDAIKQGAPSEQYIDYDGLDLFFSINKRLADKYGMKCWTNAESFDRDMPIRFPPIKFDKLRLKLEAAKRAGYDKAITFEFSHFMSPQSAYLQAGHLYDRYKEYFEIE